MKASIAQRLLCVGCVTAVWSLVSIDFAQAQVEEIIVTARKREERIIDSPVTITAFSERDIEKFHYQDMEQIAAQTPGLLIDEQAAVGGLIALRGISTGTAGLDFDQSVSLNVDGIVLSRVATLQLGFFDVGQIEILKGPQALFFGKNSPGGIISFHTNDPTDQFEAIVRGSHDFYGHAQTGDVIVSGPVTDKIGVRAAFEARNQDGYFENTLAGTSQDRLPQLQSFMGRLTVTARPSDSFDLRAKFVMGNQATSGNQGGAQAFYCPTAPAPGDDCVPNHKVRFVDATPAAVAILPYYLPDGGRNKSEIRTIFGSVEGNYHFANFKLTNVAGINYFQQFPNAQIDVVGVTGPNPGFQAPGAKTYRSVTEELRLASQFRGPLQFMVGGFYQKVYSRATQFAIVPRVGNQFIGGDSMVTTNAYSFYGQMSYDILPDLNLSGGARYSKEDKSLDKFRWRLFGSEVNDYLNAPLRTDNLSPEATLTWKPQQDLTVYGSYKKGFKSGGFDLTITGPGRTFGPEHVAGYEAGAKGLFFNRQLAVNVAAYSYLYRDLQVTAFDPATIGLNVRNAGRVKLEGAEFSMDWSPEKLSQLRLKGGVVYTRARFRDYLGPCYTGQTQALGCNVDVSAGIGRAQNLTGVAPVDSPDWSANLDVDYKGNLSATWLYGLSVAASYTGAYQASDKFNPAALQADAWRLNASGRIFSDNGHWELAVIGRNLTDVFRTTYVQEVVNTGSGTGSAGTGVSANLFGLYAEPRSVALQVTYRY